MVLLAAGQIGVMQQNQAEVTQFVEQILHATPPPSNRIIQIHPPGRIGEFYLKANPNYQLWERIEFLLQRNLLLAASILNDDVGVKRSLEQEVGRKTGEIWLEKHYLHDSIHEVIRGSVGLKWTTITWNVIRPMLKDENRWIRKEAVEIFGQGQQWNDIISHLTDKNEGEYVRQAAVKSFSASLQWKLISIALEDGSPNVHGAALEVLTQGRQWDIVLPFLDALWDEYLVYYKQEPQKLILFTGMSYEDITDEITREIINLGIYLQNNDVIGPNTVISYLRNIQAIVLSVRDKSAIIHSDADVRSAAVQSFGRGQEWDTIRPNLTDESADVRRVAVEVFGAGQQWDTIRPALTDAHWYVREAAVKTLGAGQQWDTIRPALTDAHWRVREAAVEAFGAGQQWEPIRFALTDKDSLVRQAAVKTFGAGQQWEAIRFALTDDDETVRLAAVTAFGAGQQWEAIRFALTDAHWRVREAAVEAFGAGQQWEAIQPALADDEFMRSAAVQAFANHPEPSIELITTFSTILQTNPHIERQASTTLLVLVNRYEVQRTTAELEDD